MLLQGGAVACCWKSQEHVWTVSASEPGSTQTVGLTGFSCARSTCLSSVGFGGSLLTLLHASMHGSSQACDWLRWETPCPFCRVKVQCPSSWQSCLVHWMEHTCRLVLQSLESVCYWVPCPAPLNCLYSCSYRTRQEATSPLRRMCGLVPQRNGHPFPKG